MWQWRLHPHIHTIRGKSQEPREATRRVNNAMTLNIVIKLILICFICINMWVNIVVLALKSGPQIATKTGNPAGLLFRRIWYSVGKSRVLGITEYCQGRPCTSTHAHTHRICIVYYIIYIFFDTTIGPRPNLASIYADWSGTYSSLKNFYSPHPRGVPGGCFGVKNSKVQKMSWTAQKISIFVTPNLPWDREF